MENGIKISKWNHNCPYVNERNAWATHMKLMFKTPNNMNLISYNKNKTEAENYELAKHNEN